MGLSRAPFGELLGVSWGSLGSSFGPQDRPKGASRFVLELSWASFARFLLPKVALGGFWGRLSLVFGAPEGLLGGVLASVKPISTIKTAIPIFDILLFLALVLVLLLLFLLVFLLLLVLVLVVVLVVSLLPCNFSSTRLGGMRGAIE